MPWTQQNDGSYTLSSGAFVQTVERRTAGWHWRVELAGDPGDQDTALTLPHAQTECEDAMQLIVDELFDEITMQV